MVKVNTVTVAVVLDNFLIVSIMLSLNHVLTPR